MKPPPPSMEASKPTSDGKGRAVHRHLNIAGMRGVLQLATHAITGVTRIVEEVNQSVWSTVTLSPTQTSNSTRGMVGFTCMSIRGISQGVGTSMDALLAALQPFFEKPDLHTEDAGFESMRAILNGVMGDFLQAQGNPLASPMQIRACGQTVHPESRIALPHATPKIVLLIHGLCKNDLQWRADLQDREIDYGRSLSQALGATAAYLRYNSGLHISENGRELSNQLERLMALWPKSVDELMIVSHSMGGLVARSAYQHAREQGAAWPRCLSKWVFLGTPHHGAPMERIGNWVDVELRKTRYFRPFSRMARLRSAGITDLRYGNLMREDWEGLDRFQARIDHRCRVPLPEDVRSFTIAATLTKRAGLLADRIVGDGLVPLRSALGHSDDPTRNLEFEKSSQRIIYQTHHLELLHHPEVERQLLTWLGQVPSQRS